MTQNRLPVRTVAHYRLRVLGWLADLFRLAWGLLYLNTRKAWFQLCRGRAPCPCQSPSETGREARVSRDWPARFRSGCLFLVETPQGLRNSTCITGKIATFLPAIRLSVEIDYAGRIKGCPPTMYRSVFVPFQNP
jgi:hypothetical protein